MIAAFNRFAIRECVLGVVATLALSPTFLAADEPSLEGSKTPPASSGSSDWKIEKAPLKVEWEPFILFDQNIFPSFILSTATMKDEDFKQLMAPSVPVSGIGRNVAGSSGDKTGEAVVDLLTILLGETDPPPSTETGGGPPQDRAASGLQSPLGDPKGFVGIRIVSPSDGTKIRIEVSADGIADSSSFEATLGPKGGVYSISPKIKWKYRELRETSQPVPADFEFKLYMNSKLLAERTVTASVHSVDDCVFAMVENESFYNLSGLFAAYVNENHPAIDPLLRRALDLGIVNQFDDYQSGDPNVVVREVFAVWAALQEQGFQYSNVVVPSARSAGTYSQAVRTFERSLETAQANCVDGTVLMASILRKIGLDVYLVQVPGHMFLAVSPQPGASPESMIFVETTSMGQIRQFANQSELDDMDTESFVELSASGFEAALRAGHDQYASRQAGFGNPLDLQHLFISLERARELGIMPLPFAGTKSTTLLKNKKRRRSNPEEDESSESEYFSAEGFPQNSGPTPSLLELLLEQSESSGVGVETGDADEEEMGDEEDDGEDDDEDGGWEDEEEDEEG